MRRAVWPAILFRRVFAAILQLEGYFMLKAFKLWVAVTVAAMAGVVTAPAYAVIDVVAATTGIADAQAAVLTVLAAMIVMASAIFGVRKVLRLLGR